MAAPPSTDAAAVGALQRRLFAAVTAITLVLLVASTAAVSRVALRALEREVLPGMGREATAIGTTIAAQIGRAVAVGVPLDKLQGVEAFFATFLANQPTLDSIALAGLDGAVMHTAHRQGDVHRAALQDVTVPVLGPDGPLGQLRLGVNAARLERSAADSRWDILIVLLASVLATVEVLVFLMDRTVRTPLRLLEQLARHIAARDWTVRAPRMGLDVAGHFIARLNDTIIRLNERRRHVAWLAAEIGRLAPDLRPRAAGIDAAMPDGARFAPDAAAMVAVPRSAALARAPLFLFLLAEQLSTSFIPLFAKMIYQPGSAVPAAFAAGLPITVFAGTIALASPFSAALVGLQGARSVLALGCIPAIFGYLGAASAQSVEAFLGWRALTGMGYAMITLACQGYLVAAAQGGPRGRSMAVFVYAAMAGAMCGTAIGAVLADRLGYRATFLVSAALTACAGLLAARTMDRAAARDPVAAPSHPQGSPGAWRLALRSPGFLALVLFAAVPAKLVLSGFIFYIGPLVLQSLDQTQPEIGRQIMLYALSMLLTIRLGAAIADRLGASAASIAAAGAAASLGMLAVLALPVGAAIPAAVAVVGLAQGLASAPMLAVVPTLCPELTRQVGVPALYGYLRFAERVGSIVGPVLAAALVAGFGFTGAIAGIGAVSLAATIVYGTVAVLRPTPKEAAP